MRLHRLTLGNVKGVTERTVTLADAGVTIVQGRNETGKTTITDALDLLLDYRDDSTAAQVRAAKPVNADVGSFVEAELTAGPYRLTYAKRFHRERSTTLTVHQPVPEHHTGRAAHERAQQLFAETVDLALWRALRLQQGTALEQPELIQHASLSAALDAVGGAGLGGEREAGVYSRVQAEYERYYTATGRQKSLLKSLVDARLDALAETDRLSQELDELDGDIEACTVLARQRDALTPQLVAQRQAVAELVEQVRAVERSEADAERLRLADCLEQGNQRRAVAGIEARARLVDAVAAAEVTVEGAVADRDAAMPALTDAAKMEDDLQRECAGLRQRLADTRAQMESRQCTLDAVRDRVELASLHERLRRIDAAQDDLGAAHAFLDACPLDAQRLEALEAAEAAVVRARASVEVRSPVVTVTALQPIEITTDGEPADLKTGEQTAHNVAGTLDLRVGDLAGVVIRAGEDTRDLGRVFEEAVTRRDALLAAAGVDDMTAARALERRRAEAQQTAEQAQSQLEDELGDSTPALLADRAERLGRRIADVDVGDVNADEVRARLDRLGAAVVEDTAQLARAEGDRDDISVRREQLAREVAVLDSRSATAKENLTATQGALRVAREATTDRNLEAALAEADRLASAARAAYGQALADMEAADADGVRARHRDTVDLAERQAADLRAVEDELRDVRSRLVVRGEQGLHDRFEQAMAVREQAERAYAAAEARAEAARLLFETMSSQRDAARRAYASPFRDKLERLGKIVFGDDLRVELDDDLRVARRTLNGVTLDFDQLSGGAREQLTVLARLACAAIVSADGGVPLILDDALGYTDPLRLERLGAAFRVGARDCQVVILTCVPERYAHITDATVVPLD